MSNFINYLYSYHQFSVFQLLILALSAGKDSMWHTIQGPRNLYATDGEFCATLINRTEKRQFSVPV